MKQLGAQRFWRAISSLTISCKVFLALCIFQALLAASFAAQQIATADLERLQDLLLIIISAFWYLFLVFDAFFRENGTQLLVCMAAGAINLLQLVVYATTLVTGRDNAAIAITAACAVLQTLALTVARFAYLGFGWRTFSKIASGISVRDAEKQRADGLRLHRFSALAKLDAELIALLFTIGIVNGINPDNSGVHILPTLLATTCIGCCVAATWLTACWFAVLRARPRLRMAAELTHPICYVLAGAFIMSGVYYGVRGLDQLRQQHASVVLASYAVLFVLGTMAVWWDARLLSSTNLLNAADLNARNQKYNNNNADLPVPAELVPLIRGNWLLKLRSGNYTTTNTPTKKPSKLSSWLHSGGRWRFFQLSQDGSTLRWDWKKYVLLMHVLDIECSIKELTIVLKLALEPDLRLKFPDEATLKNWATGLKLLLRLLGNPDGIHGRLTSRLSSINSTSSSSCQSSPHRTSRDGSFIDPGSPSRILQRLAHGGSHRPSAAGLLTAADLEAASVRARQAWLNNTSSSLNTTTSFDSVVTPTSEHDIESRGDGVGDACSEDLKPTSPTASSIIVLHATTVGDAATAAGNVKALTAAQQQKQGGRWWDRMFNNRIYPSAKKQTTVLPSLPEDQEAVADFSLNQLESGIVMRKTNNVITTDNALFNSSGGIQAMFHQQQATVVPDEQQQQQQYNISPATTPSSVLRSLGSHGSTYNVEIIDFSELEFGRLLGEGAEGPVHAAWLRDSPVAVKTTRNTSEADIQIHSQAHDNIVSLRAVCYKGEYTYLVMEMAPRGTLDVLIHSQKTSSLLLEPVKLLSIVRGIARGMLHLHTRSPPILHRDLKPANCFIGHGFQMKIGDFGMARMLPNNVHSSRSGGDSARSSTSGDRHHRRSLDGSFITLGSNLARQLTPGVIGTAAYSAPEVLLAESPRQGQGASIDTAVALKADVYSFGVLLWEMLERKRPHEGSDSFYISTQWLINPEGMKLPSVTKPEGLSPAGQVVFDVLAELVVACTAYEPVVRPSFKEILAILRTAAPKSTSDGF